MDLRVLTPIARIYFELMRRDITELFDAGSDHARGYRIKQLTPSSSWCRTAADRTAKVNDLGSTEGLYFITAVMAYCLTSQPVIPIIGKYPITTSGAGDGF